MNILFGFVYGLGWFVAGFIADVRSRNVEPFGSMIWPLMVMLMITYFLGKLLSRFPKQRNAILVGCIFLLLLIVPRHWVATTPLKYIPTYAETLASVY